MKRVLMLISLIAIAVTVPAQPAFAGEPSVQIGRDRVAVDDIIQIRGSRWPAGDLVTIELCGNDALDFSVDCDIRNSVSFAVRDSTEFFGALQITYPPSPCPCVVRVSSQGVPQAVTVPIDFPSAGFVPAEQQVPDADISRTIDITALEIQKTSGWTTWFGAPASWWPRVTITNNGNVAISDTTLTLTSGKGADPTDIISSWDLMVIEVGETIRMSVPFELDALSVGTYTVKATISGLGQDIEARGTTNTIPWGLIVIALIVLQFGLLLIRNGVRGHVSNRVAADDAWLEEVEDDSADGSSAVATTPADGAATASDADASDGPSGDSEAEDTTAGGDDAIGQAGESTAARAAVKGGAVGEISDGAEVSARGSLPTSWSPNAPLRLQQ